MASAADCAQFPAECSCPIMQEVMEDPVVAADGSSYERRAIEQWLQSGRSTSPLTNLPLSHHTLIPNNALRSLIQDVMRRLPDAERIDLEQRWRRQDVAPISQETLSSFSGREPQQSEQMLLTSSVMQASHPAMLLLALNRRLCGACL
eukprot:TRINITY_DN113570_c0_g1_i1.p1 TRINITY_DN113570_c0_g1~~TRINITY_DN113570_c0_g1_i1.p1  ORF type:complete len:148 (+),score=17.55 TRINITY_DN113570_c0_g1_i1:65-508(+)